MVEELPESFRDPSEALTACRTLSENFDPFEFPDTTGSVHALLDAYRPHLSVLTVSIPASSMSAVIPITSFRSTSDADK